MKNSPHDGTSWRISSVNHSQLTVQERYLDSQWYHSLYQAVWTGSTVLERAPGPSNGRDELVVTSNERTCTSLTWQKKKTLTVNIHS